MESSTLLESMTETPLPVLSSLARLSTRGWNSANETPFAAFPVIVQLLPMTPPLAITTPDPVEFSTTRSETSAGPLLVQLLLRKRIPAPSWELSGDSGPLLRMVIFESEVEESVVYALKPTIALSSITASVTLAPDVLTSNAAPIPSPGVLASGPPVPRTSSPVNTALVCRLE